MPPISSLLATGYWLLATSTPLLATAPPTPLLATSVVFIAPQIPPPPKGEARPLELRGRRDEILSTERAKLRALADRLRREGKANEADQAGPDPAELPAADGSSRFVLLAEVVAGKPQKGLASVEAGKANAASGANWRPEREAIRLEAAKALFDLAGQAAKATPEPSFALADECLRGVIARQTDHPEARRLLGFLPHQGGWATPHAVEALGSGKVDDPTYGWVPGDWVPHLRRGELPTPDLRRWLPAAEADDLRRDFAAGWRITTEHFRIRTNVPLSEAISFGRKLEALHQLFFAMMADVIGPDQLPLAQRFKNPAAKPVLSKNLHHVYYYATRDEYAQNLAPLQGAGSRVSLGTYVPKKESRAMVGISYFFNDVGGQLDVESTLYHEASHQLLFESAGPDDYVKNVGQYWVFEGLGTYFETLEHEPDGSLRIGGLIGPRIAQAKLRLLQRNEFIPIDHLVAMNPARFKGDGGGGDIHLHYAEAMALAVFLMQADGGRHREGFLDYVQDAYKGRFRSRSGRSLDDRLGVPYPELNRAFLAYLERGPKP